MAKAEKIVVPILYVCTKDGCKFSGPEAFVGEDGKVKPPYAAVSVKAGETGVCPLCGSKLTTVEDGRHKFLRLNSLRLTVLSDKMRLIGNTLKGAQYEPTESDVEKLRAMVYRETDALGDLCDKRIERMKNGSTRTRKAGVKKIRIPLSL